MNIYDNIKKAEEKGLKVMQDTQCYHVSLRRGASEEEAAEYAAYVLIDGLRVYPHDRKFREVLGRVTEIHSGAGRTPTYVDPVHAVLHAANVAEVRPVAGMRVHVELCFHGVEGIKAAMQELARAAEEKSRKPMDWNAFLGVE